MAIDMCCCFTLEKGALFIGGLGITGGILQLGKVILESLGVYILSENKTLDGDMTTFMAVYLVVLTILTLISLVVSILLVVGVHKVKLKIVDESIYDMYINIFFSTEKALVHNSSSCDEFIRNRLLGNCCYRKFQ